METKTIDITKFRNKLNNRLIYDARLENYIIRNYTTDRKQQGVIYETVIKRALEFLVGKDDKRENIQLFEMVNENDFNHRFMELLDWLENKVNKTFGPIYERVYVSEVKDTEKEYLITFTKI